MQYSVSKIQNFKNVSTDRIFVIKPKEGKASDYRGIIDKRLFNGENKLHAVQDAGLWFLRYEIGAVPAALKQRFTNFNQLMKYMTNYFNMRNIELVEVQD